MKDEKKDFLASIENVTSESLEAYWDKALKTHGPTGTIGVSLTAPFGNSPSVHSSTLMIYLPAYLVASFLKCQNCNSCCKPNLRKWDKGVILNRDEVRILSAYAKITDRKRQHILKYPCSLLKDKKCSQYFLRPLGCRLFPFSINQDHKSGRFKHGIIMNCPAAKELYVKAQLYLKELVYYIDDLRRIGQRGFGIGDLDSVKQKFDYNDINREDMDYMKKMALYPPPR